MNEYSLAKVQNFETTCKWLCIFFVIVAGASFIRGLHFFWIGDLLTPFIIVIICRLYMYVRKKSTTIVYFLELLGKHSLEIYVANMITSTICVFFVNGMFYKTVVYILGNIVISIFLYIYNKQIEKIRLTTAFSKKNDG